MRHGRVLVTGVLLVVFVGLWVSPHTLTNDRMVSGQPMGLTSSTHRTAETTSGILDLSGYTPSGPISIGNAWGPTNWSSSFSGSGTREDPYLIQGLLIETTGVCISVAQRTGSALSTWGRQPNYTISNCVFITPGRAFQTVDTDLVVIEDCYFIDGRVYLENVENATIRSCWFRTVRRTTVPTYDDTVTSLYLQSSRNVTIQSNVIRCTTLTSIAVFLNLGDHNTIDDNIISGFWRGMFLSLSTMNNITGNSFYQNRIGLALWSDSDNCIVSGNRFGWNEVFNAQSSDNPWESNWDGNYWSDYIGSGPYDEGNFVDNVPSLLVDVVAPSVSSPSDVSYKWDVPGEYSVQWSISDDMPDKFELFRNGTEIASGIWDLFPVKHDINESYPGIYNYTLAAYDGAGNVGVDTVMVEVLGDPHNLEWNVRVNDTMSFTLTSTKETYTTTTSIEYEVILRVDGLDPLPTMSDFVPFASYTALEPNMADVFPIVYFFTGGGSVHALISPAVPAGDWSVLTEIAQDTMVSENITTVIINESTRWGLNMSYQWGETSVVTWTTWFKDDGTLEQVHTWLYSESVGEGVVDLKRVSPYMDSTTLIVIAGVGGVAAVAVVIVLMKRRSS
ncbi:MAG: nitrous oxide reductase family maturation protein NosD [Thermoplasmata archaeon]